MSGGSMDYFYFRVDEVEFPLTTIERRAFRALLSKVAKALHDIEWVDSGDYGTGDETATIRACLDFSYADYACGEILALQNKLNELRGENVQ